MHGSLPRLLAALACTTVAAVTVTVTAAGAQAVVVTPANPQGWGADPYRTPYNGGVQAITTVQPRSGNGSLQMSVNANAADRTGFAKFANFGKLSDLTSVGFDWFAQSPLQQSPTLRLYLNVANPGGGTMIGQMGWYADGSINGAVPANSWTTSSLLDGDGADKFFLRFYGGGGLSSGQIATTCINADRGPNFNLRMQSIGSWMASCDGGAGKLDLSSAAIFGVGLDMGAWPGNPSDRYTAHLDNVSLQFAGANAPTTYNFEAQVVPEPASIVLFATGALGLAGLAARRRRSRG